MSNDSRENLHGMEGQEMTDLTDAAEQAASDQADQTGENPPAKDAPASSIDDALTGDVPPQDRADESHEPQDSHSRELDSPASGASTQGQVVLASDYAPALSGGPRPWYRSRRSFSAKGGGGRVQVSGLGLTYTDRVSGATLLANVDLGFRARTLSAIMDPTGRRARALFLILAGLEEPQTGRIVAAPSRSLTARFSGRIGSVALIRSASPLDESLTIRQNILSPLSATGCVADWSSLVGALQVTGLTQQVDAYPRDLSAWERYKVLIARAIVSGTEVFLLEDPDSLPDSDRSKLDPLLRSLTMAGSAVVMSTRSVKVAATADRAILLTNGRVTLDAPDPCVELINTSLEANPEDPSSLVGPIPSALPSSFDEALSPTTGPDAPSGLSQEPTGAALGTANAELEEAALDAITRVASPLTGAATMPKDSGVDASLRGIPLVGADEAALVESDVSDLVVRARKILSDLPGSIAPQE